MIDKRKLNDRDVKPTQTASHCANCDEPAIRNKLTNHCYSSQVQRPLFVSESLQDGVSLHYWYTSRELRLLLHIKIVMHITVLTVIIPTPVSNAGIQYQVVPSVRVLQLCSGAAGSVLLKHSCLSGLLAAWLSGNALVLTMQLFYARPGQYWDGDRSRVYHLGI